MKYKFLPNSFIFQFIENKVKNFGFFDVGNILTSKRVWQDALKILERAIIVFQQQESFNKEHFWEFGIMLFTQALALKSMLKKISQEELEVEIVINSLQISDFSHGSTIDCGATRKRIVGFSCKDWKARNLTT